MTTSTNNNNNIDTIVSTTINTIIPSFLTTNISKSNKKVLVSLLDILKQDQVFYTTIKTLIENNLPTPSVSEVLSTTSKKSTKPKDPTAPKKPNSSYIIFCVENREKIKNKYPDILAKDMMSKLGSEWKLIKDTPQADKYTKQAQEESSRYETEMKNYTPSNEYLKNLEEYKLIPKNLETKFNKIQLKKTEDSTKPKKPLTIYFRFCKEMRNQVILDNPDFKFNEVSKELGRLWKNEVLDEEKERYRQIFNKEMNEYKLTLGDVSIKETDEEREEREDNEPLKKKSIHKKLNSKRKVLEEVKHNSDIEYDDEDDGK